MVYQMHKHGGGDERPAALLDPVPEDTPQYFDPIKKPMDLSTIQAKLRALVIGPSLGSLTTCCLCRKLRKYNGKDSNLGVAADAFETLFRKTVIENIEAGLKVTKKPSHYGNLTLLQTQRRPWPRKLNGKMTVIVGILG